MHSIGMGENRADARGLADYHTHTAVTIDGRMTVAQACERAVAVGLCEIAFTNHAMLIEPDYHISPDALISQWEQIQVCQRQYPQLKIRLGLELDYHAGREDEIATLVQSYENLIGRRFDVVLGSVHHLHGVFFSSEKRAVELFQRYDIVTLYRDYFAQVTRAAQSQLFDVIAHCDLIKKYTGELSPHVSFEQYRDAAAAFVAALIESGVGIEINTKGATLPIGEFYPSEELLALYIAQAKACGVAPIITLGSDAHKVEDVGARFVEGVAALRRAGHSTLTMFDARQPISFPLD
jgi:histidinol-phosphatase (PHP family)